MCDINLWLVRCQSQWKLEKWEIEQMRIQIYNIAWKILNNKLQQEHEIFHVDIDW